MTSTRTTRVALGLMLGAAVVAGGCGKKKAADEAPVATATVTLNHDRVPAGAPMEIAYKFAVAPGVTFAQDYVVMAHVVDADGELLWTDDNQPPVPTSQWKPGQTIEYTRTIFAPTFPYVGEATLEVGLYSPKDQTRLALVGDDAGQHAYRAVRFQLLAQTESLFTVYKDGWQAAESAANNPSIAWQWTKGEATLAFKNPKKDAVLYFEVDSPQPDLHPAQQVTLAMGGQMVEQFTLAPDTRVLRKIALPAAGMGAADMAELQITVDKPFVPNEVNPAGSKDARQLGVRVFHAYVDAR